MCFLWRLRDDPSGFTVVEMLLSFSSVSSFSLHDYPTMAKGERVWDDGVTGRMCTWHCRIARELQSTEIPQCDQPASHSLISLKVDET